MINFDDLSETKGTDCCYLEQYVEISRNILVRLNELAGDRN